MSEDASMADQQDPPREGIDPHIWKVCAVVILGPLMAQMDTTVVNVSLSSIRHDLGATIGATQWVIGGYLLALALMLPLNAWLVDRLGAKRLYLLSFSAFTLTSLLCGMATTLDGLIAARVLQGAAGGLLTPMAQMMMARIAGKHLARLIGYSAVPVLLAPIFGPSLAGAILKYAAWPWLFFINLPLGVLAIALAARLLPPDEPSIQARAFDFFGFLLIAPGLVAFLYGIDRLSDPKGTFFAIGGVLLLTVFVGYAARKEDAALIDVRLFRTRVFSIAAATQCISNAASSAGQMLVPLFLITACGLSPTQAGSVLAPMGLGMLLAFPSMGFLTGRFGCRAVAAAGAFLTVLGTVPVLWMAYAGHLVSALMAGCMLLRGAGQGATGVPALTAGYASVRPQQLPLATTATNIAQRVGGPVGTTILSIVISASAAGLPAPKPEAFAAAFAALIALHLVVLGLATFLPVRIHQPGAT